MGPNANSRTRDGILISGIRNPIRNLESAIWNPESHRPGIDAPVARVSTAFEAPPAFRKAGGADSFGGPTRDGTTEVTDRVDGAERHRHEAGGDQDGARGAPARGRDRAGP